MSRRIVVGVIGSGCAMRQALAALAIASVEVVEGARAFDKAIAQTHPLSIGLSDMLRPEEYVPEDPRPYYRRFEKRPRR